MKPHRTVTSEDHLIKLADKYENFVNVHSLPDWQEAAYEKKLNPKDQVGSNKVNFGTLPVEVLCELSNAMLEGEIKYGSFNWRNKETPIQTRAYYEAALRHLMQWWGGENIDQKSGLSHITKAIATLVVLRDAMFNDNLIDNRPSHPKDYDWMGPYNKQVEIIRQKLQ